MRIRISDILRSDKSIKVVGTAHNGAEGLIAIREKKPDVVITDMVMPEYDGLYLVQEVMAHHPLPVIVLSSLGRANEQVFEALKSGAFDFIDKPRSSRGLGFNQPLINLVKAAAKADTDVLQTNGIRKYNLEHTFTDDLQYDIMVVGASTGGPSAIECLLKSLPVNFPVPVVIAQHMPERFIESFAHRLNIDTELNVALARKGQIPSPGYVYLCPGGSNTEIVRNPISGTPMFATNKRLFPEFNDPSIDCLFHSVADIYQQKAIGIVLTGMGKDGTSGLTKLKEKSALTIVQDEASSIVFGMPRSAQSVADYTLDIKELGPFVTSCFA